MAESYYAMLLTGADRQALIGLLENEAQNDPDEQDTKDARRLLEEVLGLLPARHVLINQALPVLARLTLYDDYEAAAVAANDIRDRWGDDIWTACVTWPCKESEEEKNATTEDPV